ncbi:potassium channel subfamily K member 5-like [Periophthalmus magnuspinnatus]|uniref:potassium channel subfamily K member 5-like n=1 Tax=Periophthalmus magnuspinnatus TaxID=409849 RepID=UPI00145B420A|nr:potassium channel subfamily K member 5-like [Periophthalmus magnuspinnatus]
MADKGPFLTACIIFYLSIGAAIFQILEEPNWESAQKKYKLDKKHILRKYECLTKEALEEILEIVAEAAGQGVAITGEKQLNSWDWGNSVIFAATIVTTIGYGNVAPKTEGGRVFCILYGLCGIPLCLVWISQLGSFFGDRARRLSQVLIRRGVSVKKVQLTCTVCFLLWGLILHLLMPPLVFMSMEGWTYLEGLYFSFITLTTVGFGDYVAGVNPNIHYPRLYRVLAELWIYMGLAWLSLFFSWNVHMVVKAHKVLRKRRHRHHEEEKQSEEEKQVPEIRPTVIDIFNFLSETNEDDYNTVMKQIAHQAKKPKPPENINRSKSCSDILDIQTLEESPRQKRRKSISELFLNVPQSAKVIKEGYKNLNADGENKELNEKGNNNESDMEKEGIFITVPTNVELANTQNIQFPSSAESRFTISKVAETELLLNKEGKG